MSNQRGFQRSHHFFCFGISQALYPFYSRCIIAVQAVIELCRYYEPDVDNELDV